MIDRISSQKTAHLLILIIILTALWVRVWQFPQLPPAFNYDESYNVIDALWLQETGTLTPFLPGNTGRHTLYHYLSIPFLTVFGATPFALRFLSVVIGVLIIPLMYRWMVTMFTPYPQRYYMGLCAAAGLTFSFWHIALSRSGFRASLLLLLYVLMVYLFWLGWQTQSTRYIVGSGIALGLAQYTYWLAAILPLQFAIFGLIWPLWCSKSTVISPKKLWIWIAIIAVGSFVVFIPLGSFYLNTPLVLQYVSQSSSTDRIAADPQLTWGGHILTALRVYLDGSVALWQGQWGPALSFDWLIFIGFWVGLVVSVARSRQAPYLFLLTGLITLWIPVLLNDIDFSDLRLPAMLPIHHAISHLRAAGILPIYYGLVAVGLLTAVEKSGRLIGKHPNPQHIGLTSVILILVGSGLLNSYNFFVRWPQQPFLYERYNGPSYDLAQILSRASETHDILIPFQLYTHPSIQLFFTNNIVTESSTTPTERITTPALMVTTEAPIASYMWLSQDSLGNNTAYLTPPLETQQLLAKTRPTISRTFSLAAPLLYQVQMHLVTNLSSLSPQLAAPTLPNPVTYQWNDELQLVGYQVSPTYPQAGQPVHLTLYWQPLIDQPLTHDIFIHAINSQRQGVSQVDNVLIGDEHRWRQGKISPTQHLIELDENLDSGPYFIRLGLFNTRTGNRLPIANAAGEILGDEAVMGLFYMMDKQQRDNKPATLTDLTLGEQIKLTGYTLPSQQPRPQGDIPLIATLYWQAIAPIKTNYTMFTQLLDSNNQFVTGFDTQPFNGTYPTSLWQPNDTIIQEVNITLPADIAPGQYTLITGLYNLDTGQRLTVTPDTHHPWGNNVIVLAQIQISDVP